jgi:hypothetical protein
MMTTRYPENTSGHSGGTADQIVLFDDENVQTCLAGSDGGGEASRARSRDENIDDFVACVAWH